MVRFWLLVLATVQLVSGPRPPAPGKTSSRDEQPTAALRERLWEEFAQWMELEDVGEERPNRSCDPSGRVRASSVRERRERSAWLFIDGVGNWAVRRGLSQASAGQRSDTRGKTTKCKIGCAVRFLRKSIKTMAPREKMWPHSSSLLWKRVQQVPQSCCSLPNVCVPSSVRPGGATVWFREWNEDLVRLQWRGRWMHLKTLAHYSQELECINISLIPWPLPHVCACNA